MVLTRLGSRLAVLASLFATLACGGDDEKGAPGGGGGGAGGMGGSSGASGAGGAGAGPSGPTAAECLADVYDGPVVADYDQFSPSLGEHCLGTKHQEISGVEKLVFLGDSITDGTTPTPSSQYYRTLLGEDLAQKYPNLEIQSCAVGGARVRDLYAGGDQQIQSCFPGPESKKTLIVFTAGGNDLANLAQSKASTPEAENTIGQVLTDLKAALEFLTSPQNFPNGSYVVFANVYEYTDLTANMSSCPAAAFAGLTGTWQNGGEIIMAMREGFLSVAVETKTDMVFMGEEFCGYGYEAGNASGQCYRGPGSPNWFDVTCIHPTPAGHAKIAEIFAKVIEG